MAITPQVYTLTQPWTLSQLVSLWEQLLIDAGLMTGWHDSYTASSQWEHRILRLTNDASKTYGYQYIWFGFYRGSSTSAAVYLQFANGWDTSTHTPIGTQYLDYVAATCTTSSSGFLNLCSLNPSSPYSFVRYTSGDYTFIGGTTNIFIKKNIGTAPSWLDLNKVSAFTFFTATSAAHGSAGGWRVYGFCLPYVLKRMVFGGRSYAGTYASNLITSAYCYGGVSTVYDYNDPSGTGSSWAGAIRLPSFMSSINPAYSSNYSPIVTGIDLFPLLDCRLPSDFGFTTTFGLTPAIRDQLIVSPGLEVWEVIGGTSSGGTNSMCLVARTT